MGPGSRLSKLIEAFPELRRQPEWQTGDRPWLVEGALDFARLIEGLLAPFLERCLRHRKRDIVTHLCAFLDLLVTDERDKQLVNQLRERAHRVFPDIAPQARFPRASHLWVTDRPNALGALELDRARAAFERSTVVFGFHNYFYGGMGGDGWTAATLADYLSLVGSSRPGDYFVAHALDQLIENGYALAGVQTPPGQRLSSRLFSAEQRGQIDAHVNLYTSAIFVWWTQALPDGARRCGIMDANERDLDELESALAEWEPEAGALYAFRYADLERPETYLLTGKRPNELGEVPIGGAY